MHIRALTPAVYCIIVFIRCDKWFINRPGKTLNTLVNLMSTHAICIIFVWISINIKALNALVSAVSTGLHVLRFLPKPILYWIIAHGSKSERRQLDANVKTLNGILSWLEPNLLTAEKLTIGIIIALPQCDNGYQVRSTRALELFAIYMSPANI